MVLPKLEISKIETKLLLSIVVMSTAVFVIASALFIQFSKVQLSSAREEQTTVLNERQARLISETFQREEELLLSLASFKKSMSSTIHSAEIEFISCRNGRTCYISPTDGITYGDSVVREDIIEQFTFSVTPDASQGNDDNTVVIKLLLQDSIITSSKIPFVALDNSLESYYRDIVASFFTVQGNIFYASSDTILHSNIISDTSLQYYETLINDEYEYLKVNADRYISVTPVTGYNGWYIGSSISYFEADPLQASWMKFYAITILGIVILVAIFLDTGVRSVILKRLETLKKILNNEWVDGVAFSALQSNDEIGELVGAFQKMSQQIQRKVEMEQLIGGVWRSLAKSDQKNHSETIDLVLRKMGIFVEADRTYFLLLSSDSRSITLANSWNREGIVPFTMKDEILDATAYPWLLKELRKGEIIHFSPFEEFSSASQSESELWVKSSDNTSINALFIIPLFIQNKLIGCIGVDSIISTFDLNHSELHYLTMIAESISNSVDKFRTISLIETQNHQLQQSQKMETVGRLAGGIAHDFNNILAGIVSSTSLFIDENSERNVIEYSELTPYLNTVKEAGDRAVSVVQQLLALSRKQEYNFEVLDINVIINQTVQIAMTSFDKRIKISIDNDHSVAMIKADATQIEQVLLNFMVNSAHAMTIMRSKKSEWGGDLSVKLERIIVDKDFLKIHQMAFENSYWKISISDTGIGISEDDFAKIYEPFYTTKKKGTGTGLGLSMVYRIVQEHFGFVEFESNVGTGTTFNIYLPEEEGGEMEDEHAVNDAVSIPKNATILVVDDEPLLRKIASRILMSEGHTVLTAEDGGEAVDIFMEKHSEIDAVILDLIMPVMSGDDTYKELIKIKPNIPVLVSSGYRKDERVEELLESGVAGFLQKPYSVDAMKEKVREVLQK